VRTDQAEGATPPTAEALLWLARWGMAPVSKMAMAHMRGEVSQRIGEVCLVLSGVDGAAGAEPVRHHTSRLILIKTLIWRALTTLASEARRHG
jgi:hypothetical protein